MRTLILALTLSLFTNASARALPQVDDLFADYDRPDVPGAAVTIIRDGKVLYEKGYGLADVENRVPVTPQTDFRLASLTKQFTAMAIMQLVERGMLTLSTPLTQIFPDFPKYGEAITVRLLLNHLSGLPDYEDLIPSGQTGQLSDDDVLAIYERQTGTDFTPGSRYRYCNGGYVLLGLIVERASGQRFSDFLRENVFKRAGMGGSVMSEKDGSVTIPNRAYGYTRDGGGFEKTDQSVTSATRGDGGVYTSVHDLFYWDQALYGSQLVSQSMLGQAFTSGLTTSGEETGYGFGWEVGTYHGLQRLSHTGSTIGFRTAISRFPGKHFSVAVLINRADVSPEQISLAVVDRFLDLRTP